MRLYFLRHGEAEEAAATDQERPLTERGRERITTAARVIAALDLKPGHIYSSPRVRARQTAEPVARALKCEVEVRTEVDYNFNVEAVVKLIQGLDDHAEVMFVGHEPSMSSTIEEMTGGRVEIKKGGLARVDVDAADLPHGTLVWLITPGIFDLQGNR
jgi:phosphohistidine phosphatase